MDTVVSRRPYLEVMAISSSDLPLTEMDMGFEGHRQLQRPAAQVNKNKEKPMTDGADPSGSKKSDPFEGTNKPLGMLDPNVYATKKTIAQGLLDVALLTANASQLKYLLQVGKEHEFYYVMMVLISFSIILQVAIGVLLVLSSRYNINKFKHQRVADVINNLTAVGGVLIVALNVIIAVIGSIIFGDEFPLFPKGKSGDSCSCSTNGSNIMNEPPQN